MSPSNKATVKAKIGAYCLANDEVFHWFQAFVRSFRKHNPHLPLTVIPYNSAVSRLRVLQDQFHFSVMDDALAARFDAIAHRVAGEHNAGGTFRKLCCFVGEYDSFLFFDSDIAVTMCFDELFQAYQNAPYDLIYFDTDLLVFKPLFMRKMMAEYQTFGFNSGAFLSRKSAMSEQEILAAVDSGEKIRDGFAIWGEQSFLNYLFQTSRRRMAHVNMLLPELTFKPKVQWPFNYDPATGCFLDLELGRWPFIHWANQEYPTMIHPKLFLAFRTLGMTSAERRSYRCEFYYRRFRAKLKQSLLKTSVFAGLVKKRDRWLKKKRRGASLTAPI